MDPEAKVQIATLGTALYFTDDATTLATSLGSSGIETTVLGYNVKAQDTVWKRLYGLATTPDFGGEPNMIDSTTLDNTEYETAVLGLQPASVLSYEFNMMALITDNASIHNLTLVKGLVSAKTLTRWLLIKASGLRLCYDAVPKLQYNADEQSAIEKFTLYHSLKSKIVAALPAIS